MKIYGKNPVIERLRINPASVKKVFVQEGKGDLSVIAQKARAQGIPVFIVPKSKLMKIGRNVNTQGVMIDVTEFEFLEMDELIRLALKNKRTILFLDGLNDPQNLGAIIRSMACLGKFSLVLPTHHSVGVTEAVLRVACGGDNYVPVARVNNLNQAIKQARENRFWIAGAVVEGGEKLTEASFQFPLGLVIGSEQKGIREGVQKNLDLKVTIPMNNSNVSLNVAQATSILCYEIEKQKTFAKSA